MLPRGLPRPLSSGLLVAPAPCMSSRPVADPVSRARSIHDKRPFNRAIFFTLVHYLSGIAFLTCGVILFVHPTPMTIPSPLRGAMTGPFAVGLPRPAGGGEVAPRRPLGSPARPGRRSSAPALA